MNHIQLNWKVESFGCGFDRLGNHYTNDDNVFDKWATGNRFAVRLIAQ
jgi:hypothetical protein